VEEELEQAWVRRAEEVTVKRLRDEVRLMARREVLLAGRETLPHFGPDVLHTSVGAPPMDPIPAPFRRDGRVRPAEGRITLRLPPTDSEWQASLGRMPGMAHRRVEEMGREALPRVYPDVLHSHEGTSSMEPILVAFRRDGRLRPAEGNVTLRLHLPAAVASDLHASLGSFRGRLSRLARELQSSETEADAGTPPSLRAALAYTRRHLPTPFWVAFLALLEEFVAEWDDPRAAARRPGDRVYHRDGWRCTAPGCTSRRHLEDHHVVYRSHGGSDDLSNRTCLCRFHHQRGEHGGLASCRGVAPLGLVWRLGPPELGQRFRGERWLEPARTT
jgi:hypothetical protein